MGIFPYDLAVYPDSIAEINLSHEYNYMLKILVLLVNL